MNLREKIRLYLIAMDFNPNHGEGGRFSSGEGGGAYGEQWGNAQREWKTRQAINRIAPKYGIDPDKVHVTTEPRTFIANGKLMHSAGHVDTGEANAEDMRITLQADRLHDDKDEVIGSVLAHESGHIVFENVTRQFLDEDVAHMMRGAPDTELTAALRPYLSISQGGPQQDKMEKEDGVSDYSKGYWEDFKRGESDWHTACHETFAEINRLMKGGKDATLKDLRAKGVKDTWGIFYLRVMNVYKGPRS